MVTMVIGMSVVINASLSKWVRPDLRGDIERSDDCAAAVELKTTATVPVKLRRKAERDRGPTGTVAAWLQGKPSPETWQ
jgi:hypothetical protein